MKNAKKIIEYINKAEEEHVQLIVFPELSITGYTCADMFLRNDFIKQAEYAFRDVKAATAKKSILVCVGMPVEEHGKLYNCAVYVQGGSIIGGNIFSFADKVFQDALQKCGVIKNDGWKEIDNFTHDFYVDKKNPRIEIFLEEIEKGPFDG